MVFRITDVLVWKEPQVLKKKLSCVSVPLKRILQTKFEPFHQDILLFSFHLSFKGWTSSPGKCLSKDRTSFLVHCFRILQPGLKHSQADSVISFHGEFTKIET